MNLFSGKKVLFAVPPHSLDGEETLGLGDVMRLLALVPNFDAAALAWCSDTDLFALPRSCDFFGDVFTDAELPGRLSDFDAVLNLGGKSMAANRHEIIVGDLLRGQGTLKSRTFDLATVVAEAIGIDSMVGWPVGAAARSGTVHDVGFNMRTPAPWAIKQLPEAHWNAVEQALGPVVSVSRQPPDGGLEAYISWIGDCRVLASVVGLGCHIAMFLGKPLLVLSGPTDFKEAGDYGPGRAMYPRSSCPHRPCHLPTGIDNCGCMGDFEPAAIAAAITELLKSDQA